MKLELNKEYRTEDGRKVVMIHVDYDGSYHDADFSGVWNEDGTPCQEGSQRTKRIVALWNEPPRVDRYDFEWIGFERDAEGVYSSFHWHKTPEGLDWWCANSDTPEALARLEQMRRQWDEEHGVGAVQEGPVKPDVKVCPHCFMIHCSSSCPHCRKDTPTIRTRTILDDQDIHGVNVEDGEVMAGPYTTADELRQAAAVLAQMADKLDTRP